MADEHSSRYKAALRAVEEFATADRLFRDEELANLGRAGFRVASNLELRQQEHILLFNPDTLELLSASVMSWDKKQKKLTAIEELQIPGYVQPDSNFTSETAALYLVAVV